MKLEGFYSNVLLVTRAMWLDVIIADRMQLHMNAEVAGLKDQIDKMADVIVTLKIMPDSIDTDLAAVEKNMKEKIEAFEGYVGKVEIEDVAFGIKALKVVFAYDEKKGTSDELENDINTIEGVQSVDVVDVRRAFG